MLRISLSYRNISIEVDLSLNLCRKFLLNSVSEPQSGYNVITQAQSLFLKRNCKLSRENLLLNPSRHSTGDLGRKTIR